MMTIICAWCREVLGTKHPEAPDGVSHGMCPACREIFEAEARALYPIGGR